MENGDYGYSDATLLREAKREIEKLKERVRELEGKLRTKIRQEWALRWRAYTLDLPDEDGRQCCDISADGCIQYGVEVWTVKDGRQHREIQHTTARRLPERDGEGNWTEKPLPENQYLAALRVMQRWEEWK